MKSNKKIINVLTILKLLLVLALIVFTVSKNKWDMNLLLSSIFEYFCLLVTSEIFMKIQHAAGYAMQLILSFFFLLNLGVMAFSGSFVTYLMWSNLANVSALGASLPLYISAVIAVLVISLLPVKKINLSWRIFVTGAVLILAVYGFILRGRADSPFLGWKDFTDQYLQIKAQKSQLKISSAEKTKILKEFEQPSVKSGIDTGLKKPNVIVIFTEGFSSEIMDVNNNLNYDLTPNLDAFSKETLNFTDYFNQTAATYRGVRGQLFSSQQFSEGYEYGYSAVQSMTTTPLISLQSILKDDDYNTEFINAEPEQAIWTKYIDQLGFEKVYSGPKDTWANSLGEKIVSDQQNYKDLLSQAETMNKAGKPFMIGDYTYQTHVGEDTAMKYKNGSNSYLDKFYNLDDAFGKFWSAFQKSSLAKNTIVVFTADHATFPDPTYDKTFTTSRNYFVSPVPMMIYYPGVTPQSINVGGRNSLALAPTVLDLAGLENHKNYFLGTSLFDSSGVSQLQYTTAILGQTYDTQGITEADTQADKALLINNPTINAELQDYYRISLNY